MPWKKEWFKKSSTLSSSFHRFPSKYTTIKRPTNQFPKYYWNSIDNHKAFMDRIAIICNISHPSDWGKIKVRTIHKFGGSTLLNTHYNGSLFNCLEAVYKGFFFF